MGTAPFLHILCAMFIAYVVTYVFWAGVWYAVQHNTPECVSFADDVDSFLASFLFSVELQVLVNYECARADQAPVELLHSPLQSSG
jgi:hypothetical protein